MNEIPLLKPEDVELRVAQLQSTQYGTYCILLCYKDARCDQRYLDTIFGPMNWQRSHQLINNSLFCTVEVYDADKGIWVKKQDVGSESNTEAIKGECSDSFKRACFNWGIGRELYRAPNIRFKLEDTEVSMGSNGKAKTYARFHVGNMIFDREANKFIEFTVLDEAGNLRFSLTKSQPVSSNNRVQMIHSTAHVKPVETSYDEVGGFGSTAQNNSLCEKCSATIKSPKVIDFSRKRFKGHVYCYECQKQLVA